MDDLTADNNRTLEIMADDEIVSASSIYGIDVLKRMIPHSIDGMKFIQRLILWSLRNTTERTGFSLKLGEIATLHQGGDTGIYDAIVLMAQDFKVGQPLVEIIGNWGSYDNPEAGDRRYIKLLRSQFATDLFFGSTHVDTLPMIYSKNWQTTFPEYLIPCIPATLLYYNITVGYGFSSSCPQRNLADVCDLTMRQCDYRATKKGMILPDQVLAKYLIPDYPIPGLIRNRPQLLEEYAKGNYTVPIYQDGTISIAGNVVNIHYLNVKDDFRNTIDRIHKLLTDKQAKNFWLYPLLKSFPSNLSGVDPRYRLEFKPNVDVFSILDRLKRLFAVTGTLHPKYNFIWQNRIQNHTPKSLLYTWYTARLSNVRACIKLDHAQLLTKKLLLSAILLINDRMDLVVEIIKNSTDEHMVSNLRDAFPGLTISQAVAITRQPLSQLNKQSEARIQQSIEKNNGDIANVLTRYNDLDSQIYNDAQRMKKRYQKPRRSRFSEDFMGYVMFGNRGAIHFFDHDEMERILVDNNSVKGLKIVRYHDHLPGRTVVLNGRPVTDKALPGHELRAERILEHPNKGAYTFFRSGNTAGFIEGVHLKQHKTFESDAAGEVVEREELETTSLSFTTHKFWAIKKNGSIEKGLTTEHSNRKSLCRGAKSDIYEVIPRYCSDMVVFHMDPSTPNQVRVDRILVEPDRPGRCSFVAGGTSIILDIYSLQTKQLYLSLPSNCLNKLSVEYLFVRNIERLFTGTKRTEIIELTKATKGDFSRYIKRHGQLPKVMTFYLPEK